ncbi:MAG: CDP-2,3-bis-(O-geranylgeranyl)-sn-glycerol synthase [Candidatus Thermoplasmatota archaeon]|jgi:CDP-2,3-bis-(O-geranylgeranyl)-sn-glycerol synthase|nr:CDP-2,3-bis-(O-geranylgeranyl)-sn-glycerol synthase [Candidatus Thermoplasmatota archaeon]
MDNVLYQAFFSLYFFLPAFIANPAAVITKGKTKMDFGKSMPDGKRILGDGKSWGGLFGGIALGYIAGLIFSGIGLIAGSPVNYSYLYYLFSIQILALSSGSMIGDSTGSFIKRRLGMKSGQNGFLLDQYPFAVIALIFIFLASPSFFYRVYWNIPAILVIFIVTPPIHRAVNIIGYKMKRKSVPW